MLSFMQWIGWGVDPSNWLQDFREGNFWSSSSIWILSLALANLIPTIIHLFAVCWALLKGVFVRNEDVLKASIEDIKAGKPLVANDAMDPACYLYADGKLAFLIILSFLPLVYVGVVEGMGWVLMGLPLG